MRSSRRSTSTCCSAQGIANKFGRASAAEELRRFGVEGPLPTTRALVEALRSQGLTGSALLDIGAGIGAIHHTLLDQGVTSAMHVDMSPEYIASAREEAARRGHSDVQFVTGDFVELAPMIDEADVVTLDRVICCYPDMQRLIERSAAKARRLYGVVYPRATLWTWMGVALQNLLEHVRRSGFHVYLHSPGAIESLLRRMGFERQSLHRTWVWEVAVYVRRRQPTT